MNKQIVKSPINWVGNKAKYISIVNSLLFGKKYNNIYESMLGSGNLLLNINCECNNFIGSDTIKLTPSIYNYLKNNDIEFYESEFINILAQYGEFSHKDYYYKFREDWNYLYLSNTMDKDFVLKSIMLVKMCSNSVIRFNRENRFNSGFRGVNNCPFFKLKTITNIISQLNAFTKHIKTRKVIFNNENYFDVNFAENSLIILDPPYLLSNASAYACDFSENKDWAVIQKLINSPCDFIYFNNEINNGEINNNLNLLSEYPKINLATLDCSGQNRKESTKPIQEILIYRLGEYNVK